MAIRLTSPPPPTTVGTGGDSEWTELAEARDDIEAHLLTGLLEETGIETRTVKDRSGPGAWLYGGSNPWAPVMVLVRRYDHQQAGILLAEMAWEGPTAEPSAPQDARAHRRMLLVWWAVALAIGMLLTGVALMRTQEAIGRCELPLLCADQPSGR